MTVVLSGALNGMVVRTPAWAEVLRQLRLTASLGTEDPSELRLDGHEFSPGRMVPPWTKVPHR